MNKFNIGIDLGGTKIESVVLDLNSKVLFRKRIFSEVKYWSYQRFT